MEELIKLLNEWSDSTKLEQKASEQEPCTDLALIYLDYENAEEEPSLPIEDADYLHSTVEFLVK